MILLWESLIDYALILSASRNGPQSVCKNKMTIATPNNRKSEPGTAHRCLKASYAVTLMGVVLTLTGCAVGPHYVKPVLSVNDSWSGTGSPQISAQPATDSAWWKAFNDPVLEQLSWRTGRTSRLPDPVSLIRRSPWGKKFTYCAPTGRGRVN